MYGAGAIILFILFIFRKKVFCCFQSGSGNNFGRNRSMSRGGSSDKETEMKRFERMADGNASAYPKSGSGGISSTSYDDPYNNNFGHEKRNFV